MDIKIEFTFTFYIFTCNMKERAVVLEVCSFVHFCRNVTGGSEVQWLVHWTPAGSNSPGSSPGQGHCIVFLGKTFYSHSSCLHPGV